MKEENGPGESNGQTQDRPGKIMVSGIPKDNVFTEADLERAFAAFGRITEAYIVRERRTQKSRGFAFITYENPSDASEAIKAMEGKDLGGDRSIHCEQAVIGPRKSGDSRDDSRGRGGGRGRGRGFERGGRGADRGGWRGARGGGDRGWRGSGFNEGRGGPRGGRGGFRGGDMRGRGDGMGMRGRGRGDYFEPGMQGENFYDHGPQDGQRGRPGRRTLLPNPGFRGQGPPHGHRGPPMIRGGDDYYDNGGDGYGNEGYYGEERGDPHNERYNESYQEGDYYDQQSYHDDRMSQRGGGRGVRGGNPFIGRAMGHPSEGAGMRREETDYSQREEDYSQQRRAGMGAGDYESAPVRRGGGPGRREVNLPEEYQRRRPVDEYGYPTDDGQGLARQEAPKRAPAEQYQEEDYGYDESRQRRSDYYDTAPRGRGGPAGRGAPVSARGAGAAQRKGSLLGHDPYSTEDGGAGGYYEGRQPQGKTADSYQEDAYSYQRGGAGQSSARHRTQPAEDNGYGYDMGSAKAPALHDDPYSQRAGPAGYGGRYPDGAHDGSHRRDDYDNMQPSGIRRDMEPEPYNRKRHMDYEDDRRILDMSEAQRDYQGYHDRSGTGGMMPGPPTNKRERYDGFYQNRQEEVFRDL